jgi:hypothetical protein
LEFKVAAPKAIINEKETDCPQATRRSIIYMIALAKINSVEKLL